MGISLLTLKQIYTTTDTYKKKWVLIYSGWCGLSWKNSMKNIIVMMTYKMNQNKLALRLTSLDKGYSAVVVASKVLGSIFKN